MYKGTGALQWTETVRDQCSGVSSSVHHYVASKDWSQVLRLTQNVIYPAELPHQPLFSVILKIFKSCSFWYIFIVLFITRKIYILSILKRRESCKVMDIRNLNHRANLSFIHHTHLIFVSCILFLRITFCPGLSFFSLCVHVICVHACVCTAGRPCPSTCVEVRG